jgi:LCP family protein required for cell wall assembly
VLKHRRRRRRFLIGLTFFLSASVTFTGSGYVYLQYRLGQIPRVDVPSLVGDDPNGVMNVLLVGSDSRAGLQGEDALQAGTVSGQRSDTIMVLHIDQKQEQAAILSVPRDLFLPIAGEGYSDRVNAAFAINGPQGLSETIQDALGITINHYVEVDFVGFKDIVDAVGGVQLYLPAWVRDQTSGLDLPKIGCVNVDGTQGLAWVRSRDFEILQPDGLTWSTDPRADLGRIERQQDFIRRMLKKALSSGLTNPIQLNRLIGIGVRDVTLDETLSTKDITTLARRFNNLDPDSVALLTLPTTPTDIDGKAVLELREDEAQPYLDRMNGVAAAAGAGAGTPDSTTTTLPASSLLPPGEVDVRVLNGEGTPGTAARAAAALQGAGFTVSGTGDATETRRTTIRYPADALAQAQLLDGALVGGADLIVDDTVTGTGLVLVIGADYQGLKPGPVPPVPRPSTTVATGAAGNGSTTTTAVPTTTAPPTTAGPPTLPPGVEC